jgi:hypothetical protein
MKGGMQMTVSIYGISDRSKKIGPLLNAAEFFVTQLLGKRMADGVTIDIEVRKTFDAAGECVNEDGTTRSRWFTIILKEQKLDTMLLTLAHEMVHVKQHVRNEISYKRATRCKPDQMTSEVHLWRGEEWVPGKNEDEYFDAPWEVEAYGREGGLVHRFIEKSPANRK